MRRYSDRITRSIHLHVVKQAGGNPQAIYNMVDDTAKERLINKRQIREMRHQAGIQPICLQSVPIRKRIIILRTPGPDVHAYSFASSS
ncbi:MAG: hypothetical protein ACREX9_02200 [Gammaproteobacteria bacterium]